MGPVREDAGADSSLALYWSIQAEGRRELARPLTSLWWSGVAAGTCMAASVVGPAFINLHLPDVAWAPLVSDLGYVLGFVIVVLGRLQLFTENTITTVLPFLTAPSWRMLGRIATLWSVVFAANLVGAMFAAAFLRFGHPVDATQWAAILSVAHHATDLAPLEVFARGIPAGFFIATVVWTAAGAPEARLSIVVMLTYLIALGDFTHVVAGSVEVFVRVFEEGFPALSLIGTFIVPAFAGNVVGGSLLFALLTYGQVCEELPS